MTRTKWAVALAGVVALGTGAAIAHPPGGQDFEAMRAERQARHAEMVAKYDANKDGQLDETERQAARAQHLTERFNELDTDKNGVLSLDEFKAGMGKGMRHGGRGMMGPPGFGGE